MATKKEELKAKVERLRVVTVRFQQFIDKGGDLSSDEGKAIGIEAFEAWDAISTEFGHPLLKGS